MRRGAEQEEKAKVVTVGAKGDNENGLSGLQTVVVDEFLPSAVEDILPRITPPVVVVVVAIVVVFIVGLFLV